MEKKEKMKRKGYEKERMKRKGYEKEKEKMKRKGQWGKGKENKRKELLKNFLLVTLSHYPFPFLLSFASFSSCWSPSLPPFLPFFLSSFLPFFLSSFLPFFLSSFFPPSLRLTLSLASLFLCDLLFFPSSLLSLSFLFLYFFIFQMGNLFQPSKPTYSLDQRKVQVSRKIADGGFSIVFMVQDTSLPSSSSFWSLSKKKKERQKKKKIIEQGQRKLML